MSTAQQRQVLVGGTVMGDLEDVHPRQRRVLAQQPLLGRRFEISEEQQGQSPGPDEQRDTGVVGLLRFGDCCDTADGPQDAPVERTDAAALPGAARITGTRAAAAVLRTNAAWSGGSSRLVVWIAPTALPRNTPGRPLT